MPSVKTKAQRCRQQGRVTSPCRAAPGTHTHTAEGGAGRPLIVSRAVDKNKRVYFPSLAPGHNCTGLFIFIVFQVFTPLFFWASRRVGCHGHRRPGCGAARRPPGTLAASCVFGRSCSHLWSIVHLFLLASSVLSRLKNDDNVVHRLPVTLSYCPASVSPRH